MNDVRVGDIVIGDGHPLALISGPCVVEDRDTVMEIAEKLKELTARHDVPWIFKSSFEKDNRGSASGYRGPGMEGGLRILEEVKRAFEVPVLSDVHQIDQIDAAAEVLDVLQIPAYLCQQTSLVLAIGEAGKCVNVKKGQFLAPETMNSVVGKLHSVGNKNVLLTERGTCFGYNRLVSDLRCVPIMKDLGCPVVYDPTHIVRIYGVPSDDPRGGEPQYVPMLSRVGVAAGANALFIETHTDLSRAKCDAVSMLRFDRLEGLLPQLVELSRIVRAQGVA
ncbi:3-deoxy-8-phosphooctulonate synthase [bacterium]|nr:3-deoxy-8-phosphooctulonate synthase [bacterium]